MIHYKIKIMSVLGKIYYVFFDFLIVSSYYSFIMHDISLSNNVITEIKY